MIGRSLKLPQFTKANLMTLDDDSGEDAVVRTTKTLNVKKKHNHSVQFEDQEDVIDSSLKLPQVTKASARLEKQRVSLASRFVAENRIYRTEVDDRYEARKGGVQSSSSVHVLLGQNTQLPFTRVTKN